MNLRTLLSREPKWQSTDPAERITAVGQLAADSPELAQLAAADPDAAVRAAALARTADLSLLRRRLLAETDPAARPAAIARAAELLATAPPSAQREAALAQGWQDPVLEEVAARATDPALQLQAVAMVAEDTTLVRVIESKLRPEVRLAAIDRLRSPEALAAVARAVKGRDKTLWRRVQGRLDALREGARREQEAAALVAAAEALANTPIVAANQLTAIERSWEALAYPGPLAAAFTAAIALARDRLQQQSQTQQAAQRVLAALATLRERLPADGSDGERLADIEAALAERRQEWEALGEAGHSKALQAQFAERRIELEERLATLKTDGEFIARRDALLASVVEKVEQADAVATRALLAQWKQLPPPRPSPARTAQDNRYAMLRERFEAAQAAARANPPGQLAAPPAADTAIADRPRPPPAEPEPPSPLEQPLAALESAMADGAFGAARERHDMLVELLGKVRPPDPPLARRIEAARLRFAELAGWQRWGSAQAHEQMCAEAEALIGSPLPAPELARSVQALRERWKALDKQQGASPAGLWHRFDKACTRAYEPARRHFAEEAKKRAERTAARESFCSELAVRAQALVDRAAPAKEMQRELETWRKQWREIGPVDRPKWKELDKRFDAAVAPAKSRIDEAIERSRVRRKELIARATALADSPPRAAVVAVKPLQQAWKDEAATVMLPRGEEQRLWEAFRAACNTMFERREIEAQAAASKTKAVVDAKLALLAELETLAAAAAADRGSRLQQALQDLDSRWRAAGHAGRDEERKLVDRRTRLEADARGQLATLRRSRHFAVFDVLAQRAELCAAAEALAGSAEDARAGALAALREQWSAASRLAAELEAPLKARFERALAGSPVAAGSPEARRELALRAEILAGIDSPADEARQRMALRVEYLNRSIGGDSPSVFGELQAVAARWHGLSGEVAAPLAARFERALRAFQAKPSARAHVEGHRP